MGNSKLVEKLKNAYQVCKDCGAKYGVYSVGCSSCWTGRCDVCEDTKSVTEARDYGYLITGIRELSRKMEDSMEEKAVKYEMKITRIEIHRKEDFSARYTTVSLEDEGGGEFIRLIDDTGEEVSLDFEEIDLIVEAVKRLKEQ